LAFTLFGQSACFGFSTSACFGCASATFFFEASRQFGLLAGDLRAEFGVDLGNSGGLS